MARRKERVVKAMFAFCPNCEKETQQKFIIEDETINIQGEIIPIHLEYYLCDECGEDFEIPGPDYDPLEAAYHEFRKRKGLL